MRLLDVFAFVMIEEGVLAKLYRDIATSLLLLKY